MSDQVIDSDMARAIQVDAARRHLQSAWIVRHDHPDHPVRSPVRNGSSDDLRAGGGHAGRGSRDAAAWA